jgi:CRP-like cAMP-binding protein
LNRGDFFGELALLDDEIRSGTAIALEQTSLAVIFKPDLDEFIERYPKAGIKILRGISTIISTRLRKLNDEYFSLYIKNIKKED